MVPFPHRTFTANLAAFCALLRRDHDFTIGPGEAEDALRAVAAVGVADQGRVRAALKLVLCATREQAAAFDSIFDAFFQSGARGIRQQNLRPRHTRPPSPADAGARPTRPQPHSEADHEEPATGPHGGAAAHQIPSDETPDEEGARRLLRAPYSDAAAEGASPDVPREGLDAMLDAAGQLVRRLRLGRSRRWRPQPAGARFDFRRTMRASLETGGEALQPRWQGHPRRNPRIVAIVDGSRSMREYAGVMLQFTYALSQRTRRLDAFVFSTELCDVTRQLRGFARGRPVRLAGLTEAWGGGTRIGASLDRLIREFGHRCLTEHTVVFILSDGLDVGEPERLGRALREIHRRSACLVWLNPLLGSPGYRPDAAGMRAALPHIDLFSPGGNAQAIIAMARTLAV